MIFLHSLGLLGGGGQDFVDTIIAVNFPTDTTGVVETGGQSTNCKSANLLPLSTTSVANRHWYQQHWQYN
jgi:hypothetical protein